jgi:hypothetical protein
MSLTPHDPATTPVPAPWGLPPVGPAGWWCCWRDGGVSGRYSGSRARSRRIGSSIELRVDVDPRSDANSPVTNRVSGDSYATRIVHRKGVPKVKRTYVESWIVDAPVVTWSRCSVTITGDVRYWQGNHPATTVSITIPWAFGTIGTGTATFTTGGTAGAPYTLTFQSDTFRDVTLEIDYCSSVDVAPASPSYGTLWHDNRPAGTPDRTLTIESAYREAGIGVTIKADHTVIDDSAAGFTNWSPAELHDAMETAFSGFPGTWPSWKLWGLQAGTFDSPSVGGIMFDAAAGVGGAGEAPERQGFAVFRNHQWFTNLVTGTPTTQDQAWAMRHFLYTWVHEAGHAFNLLHSWNKSRPSSLSWMNYDWKYDQVNGTDSFWSAFRFRFDDEELLHIRHGDRAAVIMGGDPWSSGGHLESPSASSIESEPDPDVELLLRARTHFAFMEPVEIEFRLRNTTAEPVAVDARMDPKYGNTTVFVQRPDGSRVVYDTVFCLYGLPEIVELAPAATSEAAEGPDRVSTLVPLMYGVGGFTFATPGTYLVRAVYQGAGCLTTSNTLRVSVGFPTDKVADRFASEYFTPTVGLTMAMGGSKSPYLSAGLDCLAEAADRFAQEPVGIKSARVVARAVGDDFYRPEGGAMVRHHAADARAALAVTDAGLAAYRRDADGRKNLEYAKLVKLRTGYHTEADSTGKAAAEVEALATDLAKRGANPNIVAEVRSMAPKKAAKKSTTRKRPPKKSQG